MEDVEVETEVRLRSEGGPKRWQEVELLIRTMVENKPSPRKKSFRLLPSRCRDTSQSLSCVMQHQQKNKVMKTRERKGPKQ